MRTGSETWRRCLWVINGVSSPASVNTVISLADGEAEVTACTPITLRARRPEEWNVCRPMFVYCWRGSSCLSVLYIILRSSFVIRDGWGLEEERRFRLFAVQARLSIRGTINKCRISDLCTFVTRAKSCAYSPPRIWTHEPVEYKWRKSDLLRMCRSTSCWSSCEIGEMLEI